MKRPNNRAHKRCRNVATKWWAIVLRIPEILGSISAPRSGQLLSGFRGSTQTLRTNYSRLFTVRNTLLHTFLNTYVSMEA
jgi:hypothetical protein